MDILITARALKAIDTIAAAVEKQTKGTGTKYALKFKWAIEKIALSNATYPLCTHPILGLYKYSCYPIFDWIIAFNIKDNELLVHEVMNKSLIHDKDYA